VARGEGQFARDLIVPLRRGAGPLHRQIERGLREAIREGRLVAGSSLPSSRALARELDVSRGVVFEAYAQLAAEGYLVARRGGVTRVGEQRAASAPRARPSRAVGGVAPHDLLAGRPDLASFPRHAWAAAWRRALRRVPDAQLGYPDPRGAAELREALAAYLGRARAAAPDPQRIVVSTGASQGVALLARVLRDRGHAALAVEDPGFPLHRLAVARAGLEPVPVPVDGEGLDVDALAASGARAVLVTPAHQMPTGVVLSPARRAELLAWADEVDGLVVEDDYDAELRFDREPVGALQGLDPSRVAYAGSASKALANALRLGWLLVPEALVRPLAQERMLADGGGAILEQLALADLIARGDLDRHLRRVRRLYRTRRDALLAAIEEHLPGTEVTGVAAGLHALVILDEGADEAAVLHEARRAGVALNGLSELRVAARGDDRAGLVLGYGHLPEPALVRAVAALGAAVHRARSRTAGE